MISQAKQHSMILSDILNGYIREEYLDEKFNNIVIDGLSLDSRNIKKHYLFLAIKGETVNGIEFINNAIEQGAAAVLWDADADVDAIAINWRTNSSGINVPIIAVKNLIQLTGALSDRFYRSPSEKISVCGITGTNGKTSCADFIAQMMSIDSACGMMGTLGSGIYPELKETGFTTPDAITCQQWLADIVSEHANFAVMEVSSHALIQGRVNGIHFNSAVFTNLSRDHLDFHGDMDSYAEAKLKLFKTAGLKNAIINIDDEAGRNIVNELADDIHCLRYGLNKTYNPDVYGYDVQLDEHGLSMQVITPWGEGRLTAPVIGDFNASNLLAVLSVMLLQEIDFTESLKRLTTIKSVAGRMQRFGGETRPLVIVDFAHTPDALEQVLNSLRQHTQHKLWCVFGCGGDRDKGKRPLMGAIAEDKADYVVLTNDNPRNESAENILEDIKSGIVNLHNVTIEPDRQAAIHFAVKQAKAGDVVLIAGKGHEKYQLVGDMKYPFDDAKEVQQQLEACAG
ncbi:MAG: UDP-N-acetylmuramoyl-L-alanyl-D-glutamate--2,6-diaminopimelate ligase [Gammaproteobacteria bacterium]|nr:UDP-N-acetylmuramoyl-L-alanyl-D-glutamate--2,6-diaminopimelate ligase [Gammaproteobacteria bacterium]MCW8987219.1 UDP-N-acetylmuramoyl-L-alanyl-D-glutamate--2,6-diaminopimelate ligase [Gammaproteobacteria bacterium]MCW9031074.1 UDP-N-acetylmuramoyl-L-alanyl-D-glutamate--2,6-diaminopimelate ligase [Gammaproteobacteria bacterium]